MRLNMTWMAWGMKLMGHSRLAKLMQDEHFIKTVMAVLNMPTTVQRVTRELPERVAKSPLLATQNEVNDLKKLVQKLEEELRQLHSTNNKEIEKSDISAE